MLYARTKYVELDLYFFHETVMQQQVDVQHVPSVDQTADILTKAVSSAQLLLLRNKLRTEQSSTLNLRVAIKS